LLYSGGQLRKQIGVLIGQRERAERLRPCLRDAEQRFV
jgi:hypothetical protein